MALVKRHTLVDQSVQMGRVHVVIAQRGDGVKTLLVGDNKNDVGARIRHDKQLIEKEESEESAVACSQACVRLAA